MSLCIEKKLIHYTKKAIADARYSLHLCRSQENEDDGVPSF